MAAAKWSFISRAIAIPSGPGTRSGPGPLFESTCTVMPASSMDCRRRSPISGRSSSGLGPVGGWLSRPEAAPADCVLINALDESGDREMLFERDDTHHCSSQVCFTTIGCLHQRHHTPSSGARSPKATLVSTSGMSPPGHNGPRAASELGPLIPGITDMQRLLQHVDFVPQRTSCTQEIPSEFDHLVGAGKDCRRQLDAQRLGDAQVDPEIELGGTFERQVAWLCAFQNAIKL